MMGLIDVLYEILALVNWFWNADTETKVTVLFSLILLYLAGYLCSTLFVRRTWLKWLMILFVGFPFLSYVLQTGHLIVIAPVTIGLVRGLWKARYPHHIYGIRERVTDWYYDWKDRLFVPPVEETINADKFQEKPEKNQQRQKQRQQYQEHSKQRTEQQRENSKPKSKPKTTGQGSSNSQRSGSESASEKSRSQQSKQNSQAQEQIRSEPREKVLNPYVLSDAYEILGVPFGASLEECKKARHLLLSLYHPDKVAQLNDTRKKFADDETKKINASWERIKRNEKNL